jgi:hypothetical protein
MKLNRLTIEQALFALALLLAAGLRLFSLSQTALNDAEASLAIQSYQLLHGGLVSLAPHPLYILGTALLNFIFGASTFLARLLPATAGILLAFLPYLLRRQLGRRTALILAFLVALDPGLIGSSIQAGSPILGLTCVLFALAGWVLRRPVLAGICAGLALLGGPGIWPGLAGLGLAVWYLSSLPNLGADPQTFRWRQAGMAFLACLVLVGTLLMFVPAGINAAAASLPAYLSGWGQPGESPLLLVFGAFLVYGVLGLVLGLGDIVRGWIIERDGFTLFLTIWWGVALVLALVYPGRAVMDLTWVMIPMLTLAARQINRMSSIQASDRLAMAGQAGLVLLLLLLVVNLTISWPNAEGSSANQVYRWIVFALALLLLVVESFLVGWGWSLKIALSGLMWGVAALLALYSLSTGINAAGLSGHVSAELWRSGPSFTDADLFLGTVQDYTQWTPQLNQTPQIVVTGIESPAVRWTLRDFPGFQVDQALSASAQPDLLITAENNSLAQTTAYTGQDFVLAREPAWDLIAPAEWMNWLLYRKVQEDVWRTTNIILWVRADRFPGSVGQSNQP